MRILAEYIMRGRMSAVTVASSLALLSILVPPISLVSSAAVSLITLRKGAREGILVLLISIMAASVLGQIVLGNFLIALIYGLALWLPVWLISVFLRLGRSLSLVIEISVLLGIAGVVGYYLFINQPDLVWKELLNRMLEPMLLNAPPEAPTQDLKQSMEIMAHYMTGIMVASSVFGMLLGLFLARWWQALLFNPGGFAQEFFTLRTHRSFAIGTVLIFLVAFLTDGWFSEMAWNALIPSLVLYVLIGTAIFHVFLATRKAGRMLLPLFYILAVIVPQLLAPIALVGLTDTWLNIREKFLNQYGS